MGSKLFEIDVKEKLEAVGFSFHQENWLLDQTWFCWTGPLGDWDIETGPYCRTESRAILSAIDRLIDYSVSAATQGTI